MIEADGVTYLNSKEAEKYLGMSFTTFRKVRQEQGLEWFQIPGKQRQKLFRKTDLDKLRLPQKGEGN